MAPSSRPATEKRTVVRQRSFPANLGVVGVIKLLAGEKFTGKIAVNMSQGAICAVTAEDSQRLDNGSESS